MHRIAETAQPIHIAAQGSRRYFEAVRQVRP